MPRLWRNILRGTEYIYGIPGYILFFTRIYQIALPLYIAWGVILGVMVSLGRYQRYELSHTKLFLFGILDMLAALLGEIFYLVLEYSKVWFSILGFSKLGEFLNSIILFPLIFSLFLLFSEFIIISLRKYSPLSKYLDKVTSSLPFLVVYFLLIDVYFETTRYLYNIIEREPPVALILIFILSIIMSTVISIADTDLANEILTYTFFILVFAVLWKLVVLVREKSNETVETVRKTEEN